jgi:hypothetical protein
VIDSQPVRTADTVLWASRGWDNAEKDGGRKRHIAVDATGLVLAVAIIAALVQDRDADRPPLWNLSRILAWITAHRRCARDYERVPEGHKATRPQGHDPVGPWSPG